MKNCLCNPEHLSDESREVEGNVTLSGVEGIVTLSEVEGIVTLSEVEG